MKKETPQPIKESTEFYFKLKKHHFSDAEISKVARILAALAS